MNNNIIVNRIIGIMTILLAVVIGILSKSSGGEEFGAALLFGFLGVIMLFYKGEIYI